MQSFSSLLKLFAFFCLHSFLCECARRQDQSYSKNDIYYMDYNKYNKPVRYLVFPKGSTFSLALCTQIKALTPDENIFTEAVNWAITYDLPTPEDSEDEEPEEHKPTAILVRRRRGDFYSKLEHIFHELGFDGRACILRTLCEVGQQEAFGGNILREILQIIFTFPRDHIHANEPKKHWQYSGAHFAGGRGLDCQALFPTCPFSVLATFLNMELEQILPHRAKTP